VEVCVDGTTTIVVVVVVVVVDATTIVDTVIMKGIVVDMDEIMIVVDVGMMTGGIESWSSEYAIRICMHVLILLLKLISFFSCPTTRLYVHIYR
jgi:hypothetical protein